jgi:hypothetical protein
LPAERNRIDEIACSAGRADDDHTGADWVRIKPL